MTRRFDDISRPLPPAPFIGPIIFYAAIVLVLSVGATSLAGALLGE